MFESIAATSINIESQMIKLSIVIIFITPFWAPLCLNPIIDNHSE